MEKKIRLIGQMDNSDGTFESANRVYDRKYGSPTINTCGGWTGNKGDQEVVRA